jgi:hypothetical protein
MPVNGAPRNEQLVGPLSNQAVDLVGTLGEPIAGKEIRRLL